MEGDGATDDFRSSDERMVPRILGDTKREQLHRRGVPQSSCAKRVLGMVFGEDSGSEILTRSAVHAIGVDVSEYAVVRAWKSRKKNPQSEIADSNVAVEVDESSSGCVLHDLRLNDGRPTKRL